ncbi:threonine synthase [Rufibacter glacialis]|uniref:Threonine synthase n=1 Tax=Rufibacter glacialis TaxID=1259555 RepID=A0A5M8QH09_9BACT|nr:threonine synthase [Rufibacter glacialis]KAA6434508.1 threonine synthase [Rufibacter glacialis]GGK70261.1 threonine synthase [Rufibacter glacialis]
MNFYSTNDYASQLSFKEAVIKGLPQDKGLFFPKEIPTLSEDFFQSLPSLSLPEIAFEVLAPYVTPDISPEDLRKICDEVFNFPIPLVEVEQDIYALELFHGPTCAFKDVGARFMSRCLQAFAEPDRPVTVLVATSGDTGSAVANGFLGLDNIDVVVVYPQQGVSEIQEMQFTTLGQNTSAVGIEGTFDDCQTLVKQAFSDEELNQKKNLSSANSINVARWLPQMVYYFYAWGQWKKQNPNAVDVTISVPSGNFGNLAAGLLARQMGLPVTYFVAATNQNKIVPEYLETGVYNPAPSVCTIANAMDVGSPNNFPRIQELFGHQLEALQQVVKGFWADDDEIKGTIKLVHQETGYLLDPHGAIGYLSLRQLLPELKTPGIFLETAHPAKFKKSMEEVLGQEIELPEQLKVFVGRQKQVTDLPNDFAGFKLLLMQEHKEGTL